MITRFERRMTIALLTVATLSLSGVCIAQQQRLPSELSKYSAMLEIYAKVPQAIQTLPDSALKADAKIMFEADDRDAGWVEDYGPKSLREHDSLLTLYKRGNLIGKPPEVATAIKPALLSKMASLLTENEMQIVSTPCIVRIRIDSSWQSISTVPDVPSFKVREINLIVTVEDVLKGTGMFRPGQRIRLYYMNFWRVPQLSTDDIVFLSPRTDYYTTGQRKISLDGPGGAYIGDKRTYRGVYPIDNGNVDDPNNDWGYGKQIPWAMFKNNVETEIAKIKSW